MRFAIMSFTGNAYMSKRDCWIVEGVQGLDYVKKNARSYKSRAAANRYMADCWTMVRVVEVSW